MGFRICNDNLKKFLQMKYVALTIRYTTDLSYHGVWSSLSVPHRGQHHQTPPEAVGETPPGGGLFLRKVNQTETAICELWGR